LGASTTIFGTATSDSGVITYGDGALVTGTPEPGTPEPGTPELITPDPTTTE